MTSTNSFGLPQMKKDIKNRATHSRTGNPALDRGQYIAPVTEQQNAQQAAIQGLEQQRGY